MEYGPKYRLWFKELRKRAAELGVPLDVPWREMSDTAREIVLRCAASRLRKARKDSLA